MPLATSPAKRPTQANATANLVVRAAIKYLLCARSTTNGGNREYTFGRTTETHAKWDFGSQTAEHFPKPEDVNQSPRFGGSSSNQCRLHTTVNIRIRWRIEINVPFIDLKRFEPGFHESLMEKFHDMTLSAQFVGGIEVAELEFRLQSHLDVLAAVACANGTDALQLALRAVGVGEGDLVVVPNVTFWATFEAVVNVGGRPVTVDVDPRDGGVCLEAFEKAIVETRPKAALVAHLYGWGSAHLSDLRALCRQQGVVLVEDSAQAFGVQYNRQSIFKGAHISTTSFYPAKVLGGAGDGGAVFTDDVELADKVRRLGNHGRTAHYGYGNVGWNSRMDSLQAAFLNLSLEHVEARIASRRDAAAFYAKYLPETGIEMMSAPASYLENGYCNVCLIPNLTRKVALEARLKDEGIGFGNIYPSVMSSQPGAALYQNGHFGGQAGERLCASVLNLPLFPYMTDAELRRVVDVVQASLEAVNVH